MKGYRILNAVPEDAELLCDIFIRHITDHNEYISHGEIQMGVGVGEIYDGVLRAVPSPDARKKWLKYINGNIMDPDSAVVYKAVLDSGDIAGFCVAEIMEDGADPFGMICDVLVSETFRRGGLGSDLLNNALAWLRSKGIKDIYLESGLDNESAHEYFRNRGFVKVSEIYKLA